MEPLDTAKNDENSGSSKRRISSILKAPRTSIRFSDPEQLVIPVEVAKPVEKRNSKRVSFAPANDVLLFSKDVENVSSAQSPLQDLTTTVANVDQRVQMGVTEGGIQPITGMETLLNAPLHACQQRHEEIFMVNPDTEDDCTEKTMMFAADDASMDVTRSHTIIIANDSESNAVLPEQNCDPLPTCRNMDFSFSMERKKGETCGPPRNIPSSVHGLDPEFENFLASLSKLSGPRGGTPVMTKVVPAAAPSPQETVYTNVFLAQLEAQRAAVDKENEAPAFMSTMMEKPLNKTRKKRESSNRSVVYPEDDVSMDMTEAHTGNIVGNISMNEPLKCLFPTQQLYPHSGHLKTTEMTLRQQNSEALGSSSNPNGMEIIKNPAAVIDSKICGRELPSLNVTRSKLDLNLCQGEDTSIPDGCTDLGDMEMTRDKAGPTNQGMVNVSLSTSVSSEDHEMRVKVKVNTVNIEQLNAPRNAVTSLPVPECQFNNQTNLPDYLDSKEIESGKDPELRHENSSLSHRFESSPDISPAIHQVDKLSSKNAQTRRRSWADLQSKLRRLSRRMNEATDNIAMDSRTAPLSQVENAADKNSIKTKSLPVVKCDLEMGLTDKEDNAQTENFTQGEQPSITAPLNLKTKRLTSRLSMGAFMPKLPQRSKPLEPNKVESSHMKTNTISVTQQFSNNILMDNIDDEVLPNISSDEDLSETLDTKTPQRISEKESSPQGLNIDEPLEEEVFEESFPNVVHDKKRPLPVDSQEDHVEDEKRRKPSTDNIVETRLPSHALECDSNITAAPSIITQTIDSSNSSNTANIRCEATFESTFKQSLFASQLEDCTNDIQKKLNDSITVLEFFKLFNVDFVIHNPRQSVLPGKLASDLDRRPKDLLKDIHINHPKQRLYEADLQNLTQKVEGLKVRKEDGNKPLKSVNRALWEEMRGLSEKELKCFGAKLKERCNFFRKRSKVQSHEMKEVLYSSLVQANLEEQLKLRGKIQEADETLKSLDDCIHELETEFAAVEGKGLEDSKPTLKSSLEKVTRVLADNERQMSELEMQKKHKLDKLNRLRTETQDLESRITMLHLVNEWKLGEKRDNCTIYTFLYETLQLKVVFEKCDGNDTDDESQRKISDITFKFQLDDEMPRSHAHLVHKLLSQYIEGQTARVEKYPTSRFVPKLLHDVGLVVSRCRLLGEELRLLKMWGGMRLDILDMSYVDTQVRIVFSSLKAFSKFEFSVAFTSTYPYCVLQVQNFKNHIGSTTIHQIEEIVSSVTPAKNYLTKIVKRIHEALLC
ncbi:uncharacterized protein knl1 [Centroberyx gerrardi]|uniref:uncharacterized protein knl1 n=1 Tax=Centroberyx gerrardi TaxID=166262 RepID=UPI003AAF0AC6